MSARKTTLRESLAKRYSLRGKVVVGMPTAPGAVSYYSTSSLKGGKHTYKGKLVTRSAKGGQIIRVTDLDKEKA